MNVLLGMSSHSDIIKLAPVYHALNDTSLTPVVLHVGPEQDAIASLYDFFGIAPAHRLPLHCRRPSLAHLGALLLEQFDLLLTRERFAAVLVHGNTSPALALAQAAGYHDIPVGHIPADLSSDAPDTGTPEACHRAMLAVLATWHFAAMPDTVRYLQRAGCPENRINYVRNTIVDATQWGLHNLLSYSARTPGGAAFFAGDLLRRLQDGRVVLVHTQTRAYDADTLARIAQAVCVLVEAHAGLRVVWPIQERPGLRDVIQEAAAVLPPDARSRLILIDPPAYPQLLWLLKQTWLVVADTHELQEEAATLHVPMLILHDRDGRPASAEAGGRALLRVDPHAIYTWISRLLAHPEVHRRMATADNPFGDGRAGRHIARILQRELGQTAPAPRQTMPDPTRIAAA